MCRSDDLLRIQGPFFFYRVLATLANSAQLQKVLRLKDTAEFALVWKTLTVFCAQILRTPRIALIYIVCSGDCNYPLACNIRILHHGFTKLWTRIERLM